ncbi:P-loop containing nucleoside triphosphate hydrolase protein [Aspergillus pseudoustus]|uniref:P-loop containing nucleoside triphosphate hydrolase protein n=1 Tax=Aspergillus pseudoustus TaxID=1810923 RepID=A0ABR4ILM2_9EURO
MSSSLEAKIVVLGAQGVGKTSLVQRYVKNAFNESTTTSTVGASFVTKRVLDSTSDTLVRLQIWDTAGQERFRSISRLYYRGANACLLCYDITDEHSFHEMTGWLVELKKNLGSGSASDGDNPPPIVIHVVGTKSDIVAVEPARRRVPFERTIAYVAEQLYPSRASTPPPTAGYAAAGQQQPSSASVTTVHAMGLDSKRSSGFWGQDIGWDCCHEISAKDGEGVEEVFRVIARKLVEQRNKRDAELAALSSGGASSVDGGVRGSSSSVAGAGGMAGIDAAAGGGGSFRLGMNDKRRSWLMFPPSSVGDDGDEVPPSVKRRGGRCC